MVAIVFGSHTLKQPPLYQRARDVLRQAILQGQLAPGERLTETQLAEQLGISRTPLREALRQLQSEGLVRRDHNGNLFVATVDAGEIESLYQCRIALERVSASLAARRAEEDGLSRMRQAIDEAGKAASEGDVVGLLHHNIRFHREIAQTANNRWVLRLLEQVWVQMPLFRASVLSVPQEQREILAEHVQILERIAARDPDGAAEAMEEHLLRDLERGRRTLGQRSVGRSMAEDKESS